MVTCGEEPGVGLAARWVSVSNGYMWRTALGGRGCQVGKCLQWLLTYGEEHERRAGGVTSQ